LKVVFKHGVRRDRLNALFDVGCDINRRYQTGCTPFEYLCNKLGQMDITKIHEGPFHMTENVKQCLQQKPSVKLTRVVAQFIVG